MTMVTDTRLPEVPAARESRPQRLIFRLSTPVLYGAIGVSLGALTGAPAAMSAPLNTAVGAARAAKSPADLTALPTAAPGPQGNLQTVATLSGADAPGSLPAGGDRSAVTRSTPGISEHGTASTGRSPAVQKAPQEAPSFKQDVVRPSIPAEGRPAKSVAHPVTRAPRKALA